MPALMMQMEDALRLVPSSNSQLLHRLQRLGRRIARTVLRASALLDASRLNAETFQPAVGPVDMAEIVRGASDVYAAQAEHFSVMLHTVVPDTLAINSDRMALERIAGNLISHAFRFGAGAPAAAIVDGRGRAAFPRRIAPAATALEHMQDAADDPAIIDAGFARSAVRWMRLDQSPRFLR